MKKVLLAFVVLAMVVFLVGCMPQGITPQEDKPQVNGLQGNTPDGKEETTESTPKISAVERQRLDLYVTVMKAAFHEENVGNAFVAVKLDTLGGLSDTAKEQVLKELAVLSPQVYSYEDVKSDNTKFEPDDRGGKKRAIDGALLWVDVEKYSDRKAIITGVSWFGNLGAVFPKYEAKYENGGWQLKLIRMAVS